MSNWDMIALRKAKDVSFLRDANIGTNPVQRRSSDEIKQLKRRIQSTTNGKLSVISGFEKFKCNLIASLKLFFMWQANGTGCDKNGHMLVRLDGEYSPNCGRCGKLICSPEQLRPTHP